MAVEDSVEGAVDLRLLPKIVKILRFQDEKFYYKVQKKIFGVYFMMKNLSKVQKRIFFFCISKVLMINNNAPVFAKTS